MQLCLQIKHWRGGEFIWGKVLRQEQLPVEMLVCLLRQFARSHSHQADVCVVDCFCGTGSTAVAALALGCTALCMDLATEVEVRSSERAVLEYTGLVCL